ncbi:hypothetical protein FRC19_004578 [Serendipita sp. 401]|nr:hypothetical protein FRC19_004578 [Serendipita sp. 401]
MSNAGSRRISIAALIGNPSERSNASQTAGNHSADAVSSDILGAADHEGTQRAHVHPAPNRSGSPSSGMNPTHSHDDTHYIDAQAPRFISHQFPQKPSVSSGQFSDENQAQNPASGQMEPPSTTGNEITFEFYNPLEKKKHKQKSAGGGLESAHTQQTASSSASVSQFSPDHPHTGAQTEFVFEKGTVPSGGSKTKKERKSASSSGKSKATESTGTSKSLKKSSKDQDPTARRQVTDDAPEATGASGPAGHPSQQRAATSSSTTESALPSSSRHVSKASQSSGIPDDTTVDDDIMADLDMAELSHAPQMTTTGASSSRAASQPRYSIDHDGDLDMEILPPTPPRDRSVSTKPSVSPAPPSISLAPSTTSKKTAAAASGFSTEEILLYLEIESKTSNCDF